MNDISDPDRAAGTSSAARFLERVRKVLAHDLRTPLGTISNYAAILEYHGESKPEDVRAFAGRIRSSAVRAAEMLHYVTEAIALSATPLDLVEIDAAALLRRKLSTSGLRARFPAHGPEPVEHVVFDGELLAFTWRAFLAVNSEAKPGITLDLDIVAGRDAQSSTIELWIGGKTPAETPGVEVAHFSSAAGRDGTPTSCFALGLAEELFKLHGGAISLSGSPTQSSGLRATLPCAG